MNQLQLAMAEPQAPGAAGPLVAEMPQVVEWLGQLGRRSAARWTLPAVEAALGWRGAVSAADALESELPPLAACWVALRPALIPEDDLWAVILDCLEPLARRWEGWAATRKYHDPRALSRAVACLRASGDRLEALYDAQDALWWALDASRRNSGGAALPGALIDAARGELELMPGHMAALVDRTTIAARVRANHTWRRN